MNTRKARSTIVIEYEFDNYQSWAQEQKAVQKLIANYVSESKNAGDFDITFKYKNSDLDLNEA